MCRWLKPGGALLPDFVVISIAAADAGALDLDFWDDVAGFSFAPVRGALHQAGHSTAHVAPVPAASVLSAAYPVRYLDLAAMRKEDVEFSADFTLHPTPTVRAVLWPGGACGPATCSHDSSPTTSCAWLAPGVGSWHMAWVCQPDGLNHILTWLLTRQVPQPIPVFSKVPLLGNGDAQLIAI